MAANLEIWESNSDARVSMRVAGPRPGTEKTVGTAGKGQRLRISPEDRVIVEEAIRNHENNPFVNGKLSQVGGPARTPPENIEDFQQPQQLTDDELSLFFTMTPDEFGAALRELSEANVRRLRTLFMDNGGTVAQQQVITDFIEENWPITSGDTPSYREMRQDPQGGAVLSR
jgi:hypothetical protein